MSKVSSKAIVCDMCNKVIRQSFCSKVYSYKLKCKDKWGKATYDICDSCWNKLMWTINTKYQEVEK